MSQEELEMFVNSIIEPNKEVSHGCNSDSCLIDFDVSDDTK